MGGWVATIYYPTTYTGVEPPETESTRAAGLFYEVVDNYLEQSA